MGESGQVGRGVLVLSTPRAARPPAVQVRKYAGQPCRPARIGASRSVTSGNPGCSARRREFHGTNSWSAAPPGRLPGIVGRTPSMRPGERLPGRSAPRIGGNPTTRRSQVAPQRRSREGTTSSNRAGASLPTYRELCRILGGETWPLYYITVVRSIHWMPSSGEPDNSPARRSDRIGRGRPARGGAILKIERASPGLGRSGDYCRSVDHARSVHHRHSGNRIREGWR